MPNPTLFRETTAATNTTARASHAPPEGLRLLDRVGRALAAPPGQAEVLGRTWAEEILLWLGRRLSDAQAASLVATALGELRVSLAFHRVRDKGGDWLSMPPEQLDALTDLLLATRPRHAASWLTLTFDDGYDDAADYIEARARSYPDVEWLFFVCPQKVERQAGFRWDLAEAHRRRSVDLPPAASVPLDLDSENQRHDLRLVGSLDGYKLASLARCRELFRIPNVCLGNHTNCHYDQIRLGDAQSRRELERSFADFSRLFGEQKHFAFPFGTPDEEFNGRHVSVLRQLDPHSLIWSTERRPFAKSERRPGAVLPRFAVNSTWGYRQIALWLAALALRHRMIGTRIAY